MQIDVDGIGKLYTVKEIETKLKINGLREIDKKEFEKLTTEYTSNAI